MEKTKQSSLFKDVMGNYPTGVTIVTTTDGDRNPVGLTVNSFTSVSLEPLLVSWCIGHTSTSFDAFKDTDQFAVHILAGDQQDLCQLFANKDKDRFKNCNWNLSNQNLPIIENVFAVLHCKTYRQVEAGDHTIIIGEVTDIERHGKEPMLYHRRYLGSIPSSFYK